MKKLYQRRRNMIIFKEYILQRRGFIYYKKSMYGNLFTGI